MGTTYDTILVRNVLDGNEPIELQVKVDTGATMLVLPGWVQDRFQFPVIRQQAVRYANEETAERDVVYGVEVTACGRKGVFEAVVEPAKRYGLLGAVVLETLDLIAEPRSQRLYVNPRSPDLPMAEIESVEQIV
jgi:predicted aspartyl protease